MLRITLIFILFFTLNAQNYYNLSDFKSLKNDDNVKVIPLNSDENISTYIIFVKKSVKAHIHKSHTEVIYVISGSARMMIDAKEYHIKAGDYLNIPENTVHSVVVTSIEALKVLSTQSPKFLGTDRIFVD